MYVDIPLLSIIGITILRYKTYVVHVSVPLSIIFCVDVF